MGLFSKTSTYDPMSAYTPEQRQAIQALMSLASTGSGGGITLGQKYTGSLGNYQLDPQTLAGGSALEALFGSTDIQKARDTYTNLADTKFDPSDPRTGYAAFNRQLEKAGMESSDAINREAAITGNRFGTAILGEKADLAENLNLQRQSALAQLFQQSRASQAMGAAGLQDIARQEQQIAGANIDYGELVRQVKDAEAKDALNEYKRTRDEELSRIGLMQQQWENPMGTITKKGPSTFSKMLGEVIPFVGSYNSAKYGYTQNQTSIGDMVKAVASIATGGQLKIGGDKKSSSGFEDLIEALKSYNK